MAPPPAPTVESVIPAAFICLRMSSYWPLLDQPSVSRMMWRRVAVAFLSDCTAWSSPAKMLVWPSGWMAPIAPWRSVTAAQRRGLHDPVGRLVERDHAELVLRRQRRRGPQDRLLADVDLLDPADARRRRPCRR